MGRYIHEGLEYIEGRLRDVLPDVAYVSLDERIDRQQSAQVDRLNLNPLENPEDADGRVREIVTWVTHVTENNTQEAEQKFRFRAYSVKGGTQLFSAQVTCKDGNREPPITPIPESPWPPATQTIEGSASQTMQALMAAMTRFVQLLMSVLEKNNALHLRMMERLEGGLSKRDGTIERLVEAHTTLKLGIAEFDRTQQIEVEQARQQGRLVQQGMDTVKELGSVWLQLQGIPPELKSLLTVMAEDPEVAEQLKNPAVIAALKDPGARKVMVQLFTMMAAEAKERAADNTNSAKEG